MVTISFYKEKTDKDYETVENHGSFQKCYKCDAPPYQVEFIWKQEVCHRYYVCKDHVIGFHEAKYVMLATEYGCRALNPLETPVWKPRRTTR